jgi:hypothetical protein
MQINKPFLRFAAGFALVVALLWGYWWVVAVLSIVFLFLFPSYYEIIAVGVAYDALYGVALPQFYNFPYVFTAASIVLFIIAYALRKKLIAYEDV